MISDLHDHPRHLIFRQHLLVDMEASYNTSDAEFVHVLCLCHTYISSLIFHYTILPMLHAYTFMSKPTGSATTNHACKIFRSRQKLQLIFFWHYNYSDNGTVYEAEQTVPRLRSWSTIVLDLTCCSFKNADVAYYCKKTTTTKKTVYLMLWTWSREYTYVF